MGNLDYDPCERKLLGVIRQVYCAVAPAILREQVTDYAPDWKVVCVWPIKGDLSTFQTQYCVELEFASPFPVQLEESFQRVCSRFQRLLEENIPYALFQVDPKLAQIEVGNRLILSVVATRIVQVKA